MLRLSLYAMLSLMLLLSCEQPTPTSQETASASTSTDSLVEEAASRAGKALPADDYATLLTDILQRVVTSEGLVRYERLRAERGDDFHRVLKSIETYDLSTLNTQAEKLAFWLNAYNVHMIKHILDTPDVHDIQKDGYADDFFQTPVLVGDRSLTLNQIEHVILRRQDGPEHIETLQVDSLDPRIHAGLNCAAQSCPSLRRRAFTPEDVHHMLDHAFRDFVNDPKHIRVNEENDIVLSSLLKWYGADFDRPNRPAGDYLRTYMEEDRPNYETLNRFLENRSAQEIQRSPKVSFSYSWQLNRAEP